MWQSCIDTQPGNETVIVDAICDRPISWFNHLEWLMYIKLISDHISTYLYGIFPAPSHTGSCSLKTQCSSSQCLFWASEREQCWPFDSGWRRCLCTPGWCRTDLYHSRLCRCTLADLICIPQRHLIGWWYWYESQECLYHLWREESSNTMKCWPMYSGTPLNWTPLRPPLCILDMEASIIQDSGIDMAMHTQGVEHNETALNLFLAIWW